MIMSNSKKKVWTPFFSFLNRFSYPDKMGIKIESLDFFMHFFNSLNIRLFKNG
jgi:hypothetical protein